MAINITKTNNGNNIAELIEDGISIRTVGDALDLMANCYSRQATRLIVHEYNIIPEFFDLKTGILGEILQKFATYGFRLAVVGDFSKFQSKSFKDFIYESNKMGGIIFVATTEEAEKKLAT